jgi:tetratricopeptide (TPR) repeat protein
MLDKINNSPPKRILIVYAVLIIINFAVFWPVTQHEFSTPDEAVYVTNNSYVQTGITLDGIRWAFSDISARFWHPLTWLSLMLDYQIYGLNAFGYNLTNIILHVMSTLLLFWLFNRMTGDIWKSAFIAALFAVHPLRASLFGSIHRRKDLLSVFFCMLTLCLYVYYTEKPVIKRYLSVLFSFICALMSKPMVVTLPAIMILLDYWPLGRFKSRENNLVFWQLKEKIFFFILSALFSVIAIYAHYDPTISSYGPPAAKISKACVAYLSHLQQFFLWPHETPLFAQLSVRQALGPILFILFISFAVTIMVKRLPYLFVGWSWFIITLLPVIGIVQSGHTDLILTHYAYLSSIGIAIMLVWGIPLLFTNRKFQKIILFPLATALIIILAMMTWQRISYLKNETTKSSKLLQVTKNNYITNKRPETKNILSKVMDISAFPSEEEIKNNIDYYSRVIRLQPDNTSAYNNRGTNYNKLGKHEFAIEDYSQAIRLKPDYAIAYSNRGLACYMNGFKGQFCSKDQFRRDVEKACSLGNCKMMNLANFIGRGEIADTNHADNLKYGTPYYIKCIQYLMNIIKHAFYLKSYKAQLYNEKGIENSKHGKYKMAIDDFNQAIRLKPDFADAYNNRGLTYSKQGQYQPAIEDFNRAIHLRPDYASAFINRGVTYITTDKKEAGCLDAQKACSLGNCELLEMAKSKKYCR